VTGGVFLLPARVDLVIGTLWPGKAAAGEGRLEIVRGVAEPAGEVGVDIAGVPVWRAGAMHRCSGLRIKKDDELLPLGFVTLEHLREGVRVHEGIVAELICRRYADSLFAYS
jgi:hypothetical protein